MKRHQAQGHQHKRKAVKPAYADCRVRCRQRGSSSCVGNRRGRRRVGGRSRCLRRFVLIFLLKCIIGCDLYLAVPTPLFFLCLLLDHPPAISSHLSASKDGLCVTLGCPTKCKKHHPTRLHPLLVKHVFFCTTVGRRLLSAASSSSASSSSGATAFYIRHHQMSPAHVAQ